MMLCDGRVIFPKSPGQAGGKAGIEKVFIELEARLSCFGQDSRHQLFEQRSENNRIKQALRLKLLGTKLSSFTGKSLEIEKEFKIRDSETACAIISKNKQDGQFKKSEKAVYSDSSCKQNGFEASGFKNWLSGTSPFSSQIHSGEDWRSLSRALESGAKVSAISNHELMRIAELRFSSDMHEGDSGNQVVLLQKALFWLGHLSKQSDITGYFGSETKQALRGFQRAHGVSQTGLWGPLSKQALWHTVSAEILHRAVDEKSSKAPHDKNFDSAGKPAIFKHMFQSCFSTKIADVFAVTSPKGDWRLVSGITFLVVGVLLGLLISHVSFLPFPSNLVKRKIVRSLESVNQNSHPRAEKQDDVPSSNRAPAVMSISEPNSRNISHTADMTASSRTVDLALHEREMFPLLSHVSSLGQVVQNGASKSQVFSRKHVVPLSFPTRKASSSKVGTESITEKQPGHLLRPIRQSVSYSKPREKGSSSFLSGQKDEYPRVFKRSENDFPLAEEDGAAIAIQEEEEPNVRKRMEELRKAVEAAEQNGQAAVLALAEERKRSLDLEEKIGRQRASAAALEEEVRVLKQLSNLVVVHGYRNLMMPSWNHSERKLAQQLGVPLCSMETSKTMERTD